MNDDYPKDGPDDAPTPETMETCPKCGSKATHFPPEHWCTEWECFSSDAESIGDGVARRGFFQSKDCEIRTLRTTIARLKEVEAERDAAIVQVERARVIVANTSDEFNRLIRERDAAAAQLKLAGELVEAVKKMQGSVLYANSPAVAAALSRFTAKDAPNSNHMTAEEADAAYDAAPSIPISREEIDRLVKMATSTGGNQCEQNER